MKVNSATENSPGAYQSSRQRLQRAREALRQMREETAQGLEQQLQRAREQLAKLAQQLEYAAHSAQEATIGAASKLEQAIALRVRRFQARTTLLQAKNRACRAVMAAYKQDFGPAKGLLESAAEMMHSARELLGDDHVYDSLFAAVLESLRYATVAVQAHAANVREKIDEVVADTDRLISNLESDEQRAANEIIFFQAVAETHAVGRRG